MPALTLLWYNHGAPVTLYYGTHSFVLANGSITLDWILLSLLSAVTFALVSITDKLLISRYMPGYRSFGAWVGMITFAVGMVLVLAVPTSREIGVVQAVVAIGAGFLWGLGLTFFFLGMRSLEVSRAVSVYYIHPIIVAVLASVLLGESLSVVQWGAVVITVAGVVLLTVQGKSGNRRLDLNRSIVLIVVAAALTAGAQLLSKHALGETEIWGFYPYWQIGLSMPFLVLLNPSTLRDVRWSLSRPSSAGLMVGGEAILGSLAALITLFAIQAGPVSLVAAITGTRPIFVFFVGTFLSLRWWKLLDEPIHKNVLMQKALSILLVVAGVVIISAANAR